MMPKNTNQSAHQFFSTSSFQCVCSVKYRFHFKYRVTKKCILLWDQFTDQYISQQINYSRKIFSQVIKSLWRRRYSSETVFPLNDVNILFQLNRVFSKAFVKYPGNTDCFYTSHGLQTQTGVYKCAGCSRHDDKK